MSFSELSYYVRQDNNLSSLEYSPVDAGDYRATANNINHAADASCPTLINYSVYSTGVSSATGGTGDVAKPFMQWGPFPVRMRPSITGTGVESNRIRVRVGGRRTNGSGSITVIVAMWTQHTVFSLASDLAVNRARSNYTSVTTSSTTSAWLSTASTTIYFDEDHMTAIPPEVYPTAVSGGGARSNAQAVKAIIGIWLRPATNQETFRLDAFYAAEYVGL